MAMTQGLYGEKQVGVEWKGQAPGKLARPGDQEKALEVLRDRQHRKSVRGTPGNQMSHLTSRFWNVTCCLPHGETRAFGACNEMISCQGRSGEPQTTSSWTSEGNHETLQPSYILKSFRTFDGVPLFQQGAASCTHSHHKKIKHGVKWDLLPSQGGFSLFFVKNMLV